MIDFRTPLAEKTLSWFSGSYYKELLPHQFVYERTTPKQALRETMVNQCANTSCGKPLHYLREGRIFVFDVPEPGNKSRLQHFWLCGSCSETLAMEQTSSKEIRVVVRKNKVGLNPAAGMLPDSLAS
jgi:hypothetical protein